MAIPILTSGLIHHYNSCLARMLVYDGEHEARRIIRDHHRYVVVQQATGVPWYLIGALHELECSGSFQKHLHNGDWLIRQTVNVPAGRGPFASWEASAIDALVIKRHRWAGLTWRYWHELLFAAESYNGLGYLFHWPDVPSPYLWGRTNLHAYGKYTADGPDGFSLIATTAQTGVAPIIRRVFEMAADWVTPLELADPGPAVGPFDQGAGRFEGARLQRYLNEFPGERLAIDGWIGPKTRARWAEIYSAMDNRPK